MKEPELKSMSVSQLVEAFTKIALAQDAAIMRDENAKYNRLYDLMENVEQELKQRPGDQRRALVSLFDHTNPEVRLKAALATLAVLPKAARQVLVVLDERNALPQAADARGMLDALQDGSYTPT